MKGWLAPASAAQEQSVVWIKTSDALPSGEVLVYVDGTFHIAVLVSAAGGDPAFMDVHSSDLLAWPSHWTSLVAPSD